MPLAVPLPDACKPSSQLSVQLLELRDIPQTAALCRLRPPALNCCQQLLGWPPGAAAVVEPLTDGKLVMPFGMKRAIIGVSYIILSHQTHGQVAETMLGQTEVTLIPLPMETTV